MWFQTIALGVPRTELALDPVHWVGFDGALWLTLLLGLVSFVIGYAYILKMKPGKITEDEPEEEEPEEDEEPEELEADEVEEEELEEEVEESTVEEVQEEETEGED
jgi:flagellar biosynthesis/type III secretory pathway M-ring protein FliF/YscJ